MPTKRNISKVRAKAGRAGGIARWANVAREKTTLIRVYKSDAVKIRSTGFTAAQIVRYFLTHGGNR